MPETGIDQINDEATPAQTDVLSSHLLGGKKKHDEDKNVETEEIQHLDKGADYLTTMLLQQGVKETKTKSKKTPPKLDELKKLFVQKLVDSGYVKIGDKVLVVRRGDVIPKIESSLGSAIKSDLENRFHADGTQFIGELPPSRAIKIPSQCPACRTELIVEGAFLTISIPFFLASSIAASTRSKPTT